MDLESDIVERIRSDFPGPEAEVAIALLIAGGKRGRVARCVVVASNGELSRLRENLHLAETDAGDIIVAAEYDASLRHHRDLRVSFLIDSPAKFWCSEVANMMHSRGYKLSALETDTASAGPFEFTADSGQGAAVFKGEIGRIHIEKRDRRWTITGDLPHLERHGLHVPFLDEPAFRDAVSCYILARENPDA